ncbi:MAG: hypothetical protein ABR907_00975 [Terracidiphilus sp.]|jgi:hypothetical protein
MRRALSIFLILGFCFGPLATALAAGGDPRQPACCRRNGKHHCAMVALMKMQAASGNVSITAPLTCPFFPSEFAASTASTHGLTVASVSFSVPRTQALLPSARRAAPRMSPIAHRAGRAPPNYLD